MKRYKVKLKVTVDMVIEADSKEEAKEEVRKTALENMRDGLWDDLIKVSAQIMDQKAWAAWRRKEKAEENKRAKEWKEKSEVQNKAEEESKKNYVKPMVGKNVPWKWERQE